MESSSSYQIVDGNNEFRKENVLTCLQESNALTSSSYHVVAILGPQSGGKSTLLNELFGTSFEMMKGDVSMGQTTVGMSLSCSRFSKESNPLLVIDVEGTDSKERGEDDITTEKRHALLSLSISECLIVNMWVADVGRLNASNHLLLRDIFEVHLQLFAESGNLVRKTTLLFVLRDHIKPPLHVLEGILKKDMNEIWNGIKKPNQFKDSSIEDFMNFDFVALPHYELQRTEFQSAVLKLRDKFSVGENSVFIENKEEKLPIEAFPDFSDQLWSVILENKELDLPAQRALVSLFRCDAFVEQVLDNIYPKIDQLGEDVASISSKESFEKIVNEALSEYEKLAGNYNKEIYSSKREVLLERILEAVQQIFVVRISLLEKDCTNMFSDLILSEMTAKQVNKNGYDEMMNSISDSVISFFDNTVSSIRMVDTWDVENSRKNIIQHIYQEFTHQKIKYIGRTQRKYLSMFEKACFSKVETVLDLSRVATMWSDIEDFYFSIQKEILEKFSSDLKNDFKCTEEEFNENIKEFKEKSYESLKELIVRSSKFLLLKMRKRFDEYFRYDDSNLPRIWKPKDDIRSIFLDSREQGLKLLDLWAYFRFNSDGSKVTVKPITVSDNSSRPELWSSDETQFHSKLEDLFSQKIEDQYIISKIELSNLRSSFFREVDGAFIEAEQIQNSIKIQNQVPPWAWLVIALLGFNEAWIVVTSPLLFILVLLLGSVFFVIYKIGLYDSVEEQVVGIFKSLSKILISLLTVSNENDSEESSIDSNDINDNDNDTGTIKQSHSTPNSIRKRKKKRS